MTSPAAPLPTTEPPSGAAPLTIAVLGAGVVGRTLAHAWAAAGHEVILGSRQPDHVRARDAPAGNDGDIATVAVASHEAAARAAQVLVVTVPGDQVPDLVARIDDSVSGKVVIDTTNDLTPGASALNHLSTLRSVGALSCRAFNTVGWEQMAQPRFGQARADLPYTGPEATRAVVERLISEVGFRAVYLGDDQPAVEAIDALARLWFLLAFTRGYGRRLGWKLLTADDERSTVGPAGTVGSASA